MTLLLLARHGETDWNRNGIWQGHGDPPLNARGRQQADELARRVATVSLAAIHASDLRRAHETAEIVGESVGVPVVPDPGLREIDVGSWTGLTRQQIEERFPGAEWCDDGERREAFHARAVATVERIATLYDGSNVLLVTHGGVVRALQRHALGEPRPVLANCELCRFRYGNGAFVALD